METTMDNRYNRMISREGYGNWEFTTHNETDDIKTGGTHLQGHITADFLDLYDCFGRPTTGDEYKTDAEWEIEFSDGKVATIYNWKNGRNYNGGEGEDTLRITNWNIGGLYSEVVDRIKNILNGTKLSL